MRRRLAARASKMRRGRLAVALVGLAALAVTLLLALASGDVQQALGLPILGLYADKDISCYEQPSTRDSLPSFDSYRDRERLSTGRNIFFHETSCFAETQEVMLNCRQACAVESAARMNPGMTVNLLVLSPSPPSNRTARLLRRLLAYPNVRLARVHLDEYIAGTPIERWYASGVMHTSYWPWSHMSDVMRYLTLWKFGGIYLDLDVVVTSSLEDLTNFAGAEDWQDVAAGVIGFSPQGLGRRVADACLRDLMRNFRGNVWGNNGPGVITRTLQKFCVVQNAKDMTQERCMGFKVFPPSAFYPIFYKKWRRYFTTQELNDTMRLIAEARAIHVWNKLSAAEVVRVDGDAPYAQVARKFCPRVFNSCGEYF